MTKKRTRTPNEPTALSLQTASPLQSLATRPVDRRRFLKGAALSLLGLTVFGIEAPAFGATASQETLNALSSAQAEYEAAMAELANYGSLLEEAQYKLSECQANLDATNAQIDELEQAAGKKPAARKETGLDEFTRRLEERQQVRRRDAAKGPRRATSSR